MGQSYSIKIQTTARFKDKLTFRPLRLLLGGKKSGLQYLEMISLVQNLYKVVHRTCCVARNQYTNFSSDGDRVVVVAVQGG